MAEEKMSLLEEEELSLAGKLEDAGFLSIEDGDKLYLKVKKGKQILFAGKSRKRSRSSWRWKYCC